MIFWNPFLSKFLLKKKEVILMEDFNINLLNCNTDKDTSDYIDTLCLHSFYHTIHFLTRITPTTTTLIDNIFYNNASNNIISGNITTSISDHLTQFPVVAGQPKDIQSHVLKEIRSFHDFDPKSFEKDLQRTFPLKTHTYLSHFS